MMPAAIPMIIAPFVVTKPHAGVMTTKPATMPEQKPSTLGLPLNMYSSMAQTNPAVALQVAFPNRAIRGFPAGWSNRAATRADSEAVSARAESV